MKAIALTLLTVIIVFSCGCGATLVEVALPDLDGVTETLDYSLAPTRMPEGFEFEQYEVFPDEPGTISEPFASLIYEKFEDYTYRYIFIQYPQSFSLSVSDNFLFESLGIEWQRPDDAVSEVKVNSETAYLVRGSWSAESLQYLTKPDPEFLATYTPVWDYDMHLSLFFDFELSQSETVGVMMRAMMTYPEDWITSNELVKSAESLQRAD